MRQVSIVGVGEQRAPPGMDEAERVFGAVERALDGAGLRRRDVGFWCAGSCDYTLGKPFSFVQALDGLGIWPPAAESHVEMDGAWALYEAWVHLQCGHGDIAVAYAFGSSSVCDLDEVWRRQLDPYALAPLGVDEPALVGLQTAAGLAEGRWTETDLDRWAPGRRSTSPLCGALRSGDRARGDDGAYAIVLVAGAAPAGRRSARIRGIAHATEAHLARAWTTSPSTTLAASRAGVDGLAGHDRAVVQLHSRWSVHVPIVLQALGAPAGARVNPRTGTPGVEIPQVTGLANIAEAAALVMAGEAGVAVAHATNGPALQQNLVCVLEAP